MSFSSSMADFVPRDRLLQKAYCSSSRNTGHFLKYITTLTSLSLFLEGCSFRRGWGGGGGGGGGGGRPLWVGSHTSISPQRTLTSFLFKENCKTQILLRISWTKQSVIFPLAKRCIKIC